MRCGICGKDRNPNGMVIYDLTDHKWREHRVEVEATKVNRPDKATVKRLREETIAQVVRAAAVQATGVVLRRWGDGTLSRETSIASVTTERMFSVHHVAEPVLYASYEQLTAQAADLLEQSYQLGRPITEADVERVRLAVAEARQKAEEEVA